MPCKDVIFVLGSGRSGSSALTRILSLCGCVLPQTVFGADEGNQRGFWEPVEAATLNIEFLLRHRWMTTELRCQTYDGILCEENDKECFVSQIQAFLSTCNRGPLLVVKEPLINNLMGFWFEAARREGFSVKVLIIVRHPHEVFASGTKFVPTIGLAPISFASMSAWWLRTYLILERQSRAYKRVFVQHSHLMDDWRAQIRRISRGLSVGLQPNEPAVDGFLTRDLHRQRLLGPADSTLGDPWMSHVYSIFNVAAEDGPVDTLSLDEIYHDYRASDSVLRELEIGIDLEGLLSYFRRRPVWRLGYEFQ